MVVPSPQCMSWLLNLITCVWSAIPGQSLPVVTLPCPVRSLCHPTSLTFLPSLSQIARAIFATTGTFGQGLARGALMPLFVAASGAMPGGGLGGSGGSPNWPQLLPDNPNGGSAASNVPFHLEESAMDLLPRTHDALRISRSETA